MVSLGKRSSLHRDDQPMGGIRDQLQGGTPPCCRSDPRFSIEKKMIIIYPHKFIYIYIHQWCPHEHPMDWWLILRYQAIPNGSHRVKWRVRWHIWSLLPFAHLLKWVADGYKHQPWTESMLCGFEYIDLLILYLGMSENVFGVGGCWQFSWGKWW